MLIQVDPAQEVDPLDDDLEDGVNRRILRANIGPIVFDQKVEDMRVVRLTCIMIMRIMMMMMPRMTMKMTGLAVSSVAWDPSATWGQDCQWDGQPSDLTGEPAYGMRGWGSAFERQRRMRMCMGAGRPAE